MAEAQQLSIPHCVLLAVHYATESNINALRTLTPSRQDAFEPDLTLRILLTYLPESIEPSSYTTYIHETVTRIYLEKRETVSPLDISSVKDLSDKQARKRLHKLHLIPLAHPSCPPDIFQDSLTLFLIHRAHRIDAETGLLDIVPQLVVPFLDQSEYLRTWFISTVLPLLRLGYEYYPEISAPSLETFVQLTGTKAVETLLSNVQQSNRDGSSDTNIPARDMRGLVGPWMYGHNERKRRKLNKTQRGSATSGVQEHITVASLDGASASSEVELEIDEDWECLFAWFVKMAANNFPLVTTAIEEWDGPSDVDLGGYEVGHPYRDEELQRRLELRYAQSAFASAYAVEANSPETIERAHALLVRLAALMDFEPPPGLATSVELLPKVDTSSPVLQEISTTVLQPDILLRPDNPLTKPDLHTFRLLQMFVYSAYLLAGVRHRVSIINVARLRFYSDDNEQFTLLQRILHTLTTGPKKDEEHWMLMRKRLLWLWNWGMDAEDERAFLGAGVFGKIERGVFEREILRAFVDTAHYTLVNKVYLQSPEHHRISRNEIEKVILTAAMHYYDNASNGNRTRGGMKKASDIITAFDTYFPISLAFRQSKALLSATHALSSYSLTLQHGVPFQPVNIRVSTDPLSLLEKVLDQNPRSYTHLDNLISIGQNLAISAAPILSDGTSELQPSPDDIEHLKTAAERRVIGMAIEGALAEDDFETAYSYVVNRLTPPSIPAHQSNTSAPTSRRPSIAPGHLISRRRREKDEDDISWRAAFLAGRHRSSPMSTSHTSAGSTAPPGLRRLEQRMELLSQALLLAPPSHLPEVLGVWQDCEVEMTKLLAHENDVEQRFNDQADRKLPGSFASETIAVQPRREVGRGAVEEAPMGLFDVARGAAAAFSRSAFPLHGAATSGRGAGGAPKESGSGHARISSDLGSDTGSIGGSEESGRVRKRDMVANAVTGGLASGLGWVLGATPVQNQRD
ncbi:secretory pathway Sec39 [Lepidopterella palustris CBS 459.81]|uniref:Secretory pathway Sec39 n=1 Tax=Lepidopterella palustris CBS 459.81 TaxID=1314670 RepID=A0A8E2E705_9PEZI|nr:secretory pathway Sec39 [Lepidopterella palustris CBS 459.81]